MPEQQPAAVVTEPGFIGVQRAFAGHIRDPDGHARPADIEDRRMAIYRDLFFNNVSGLLKANFPVLHRVLGDAAWKALVRDFLVEHRCATPLFPELGQELLAYVAETRGQRAGDPPFLLELAHYEWVETALNFSDDEADPSLADPNGDLLAGAPLVSPLAWNLSYRFPVHQIGPDHQPDAPPAEPTHLVVYRNRQDRVEFLQINAVTQRMLQLLQEDIARTGLDVLNAIAGELRHPQPEQVVAAGRGLLEDLRQRHVILGTRREPAPGAGGH
jgi:hypothetical protein